MIVIVSGPPGSGKTTVARRLAEQSEPGVHMVTDEFYRWIAAGFVAPHLPDAQVQNTTVMHVATTAATGYADAGYDVFVDGVIGPWWLDVIAAAVGDRLIDVHYLVLRPSRTTALDRVRRRDHTTEASGAATMYEQFSDLGRYERHVIESDQPVDDVVARCTDRIAAGRLVLAARGA